MFRAYDQSRGRSVAVKLFTLDLTPDHVRQLVVEFHRLIDAGLDHPALAAPLATGTAGPCAYLVHEFYEAQSLDLAVREYGPAPAPDALRVAAQLAGGLDFAAAVNVTHGALHPRDVLLSPNETRLTGIGVAAAFEKIGIAPPVRRPFTPPEQIAGAPWDRRADVFGLAALMHELLSGRRPSGTGAPPADSLSDLRGADRAALQSVFARGLADDPAARYASALEFAAALSDAFPDTASQPQQESAAATEPIVVSAPAPSAAADQLPSTSARLPLDEAAASTGAAAATAAVATPPQETANAAPAVASTAALNEAEQDRYRDIEAAPSLVQADVAPAAAAVAPGARRAEKRRMILWPIAAALVIGIGAGFLGGYGFGSRERLEVPVYDVSPPIASTPSEPPAAAPQPGREFTENAVSQANRPAPTASPPAAAPPAATSAPAPAPPPLSTESGRGRVLVRSTPAGARVSVDGREYGQTPAAIRGLAFGTHQVRVTRDGYVAEERRVAITAGRPAQSITVPLAPTRTASAVGSSDSTPAPSTPATLGRFVGKLAIDSRPPGAKVYVDGKLVGNTPLALGEVRAGEHVVRIEQDGYRRWSSSVRVVAAEQNKVTASLER